MHQYQSMLQPQNVKPDTNADHWNSTAFAELMFAISASGQLFHDETGTQPPFNPQTLRTSWMKVNFIDQVT